MTTAILDTYAYPPIGMNRETAARYVGLSPSVFDILVKIGRFPEPRLLVDTAIWDREALEAAFRALPDDHQPESKRRSVALVSKEHAGHPNVYKPETLAARWQCSSQTVRNLIRRGELEAFQPGTKRTRITPAAVIAYEEARTIPVKR
jgi:excisionase family DNA binding protein